MCDGGTRPNAIHKSVRRTLFAAFQNLRNILNPSHNSLLRMSLLVCTTPARIAGGVTAYRRGLRLFFYWDGDCEALGKREEQMTAPRFFCIYCCAFVTGRNRPNKTNMGVALPVPDFFRMF